MFNPQALQAPQQPQQQQMQQPTYPTQIAAKQPNMPGMQGQQYPNQSLQINPQAQIKPTHQMPQHPTSAQLQQHYQPPAAQQQQQQHHPLGNFQVNHLFVGKCMFNFYLSIFLLQ